MFTFEKYKGRIKMPHTSKTCKDQIEQKFLYWVSNDYNEELKASTVTFWSLYKDLEDKEHNNKCK